MTQTIYRWLLLLILLTFVSVLPATAEEGQIYTIKKGDTLWDLSQRFIDDPYYWPNVWSHNPDISNPHLIFPGQKIRILDGRLEIIPAYPEAGQKAPEMAEETPAASEPEAEQTITVKAPGSGNGFILTNEQSLGVLVDSVDNRVMLTRGDMVFLKMNDPASVAIGDKFGLYQRSSEIMHPVTKAQVGTMMNNLGVLEITDTKGNTFIARVISVYREITRGAELFEYSVPQKEFTLQQATTDAKGHIIATRDKRLAQGMEDVVFIDLGQEQNVASGNLFYISRPRQVSDELLEQAGDLDLPDEVLGAAVIAEVKNQTASALIIKSVADMYIGDNITLVNE